MEKINNKMALLLGGIEGGLIFVILYGISILNPFYIDWIYAQSGSDIFKLQLGFEFYKNADWQFPLGAYYGYGYPRLMTIIESDVMPLVAILCKVFRSILPNEFSYIGIISFMGFILQGIFSVAILQKLNIKKQHILFSVPLFFINSILLVREFGHNQLAHQWLILAAFLLVLCHHKFSYIKFMILWGGLLVVAIGIHPYLFAMVEIILVSQLIYLKLNGIEYKLVGKFFLYTILPSVVFFYLQGGFLLSSFSAGGVGLFSMNLNSFFNPMGLSFFLPSLPVNNDTQWEGIAYLGAGVMFLMICVLFNFHHPYKKWNNAFKKSLFFFLTVSCLLALSPVITFGNQVLLDYNSRFFQIILGPIRATGRFIWPVWYAILIYLIAAISNSYNKAWKSMLVIIIATIIQCVDMLPLLGTNHLINDNLASKYIDTFWDELSYIKQLNAKHLVVIEDYNRPSDVSDYDYMGLIALRAGMTINVIHGTRSNGSSDISNVKQQLRNGMFDKNTVYAINLNNPSKYIVDFSEDVYVVKTNDWIIFYDKSLAIEKPVNIYGYDEYKHWLTEPVVDDIELNKKYVMTEKNTQQYMMDGFSIEKERVWTKGKNSDLIFRLPKELYGKKVKIVFELERIFGYNQQVLISLNGIDTDSVTLYHGIDKQMVVPFIVPNDGIVLMGLTFPLAHSPKEIGMSNDSRQLALSIQSISFCEDE